LRAVGKRADRLRAADSGDFLDAENLRGGQQREAGFRTSDNDALDPGHLRRNRRHQ
jgi:hypothetical protein